VDTQQTNRCQVLRVNSLIFAALGGAFIPLAVYQKDPNSPLTSLFAIAAFVFLVLAAVTAMFDADV
jgi:hypothetical protein